MAIIYVDPENGNDSNSGFSFALRKKTITNATSSRVSGDEVRVIASKSRQVAANATWSSHRATPGVTMTSVTASGSNSTGTIVWTRSSHGLQVGDWVKITGFGVTQVNGIWPVTATTSTTFTVPNPFNYAAANTSATTTYYEKVTNCVIELNTAVTQDLLYSGFSTLAGPTLTKTLSTVTVSNVTYSSTSSYIPQIVYAGQIAYTSTFTTGRVAWYTYPSALNLSAYRQISFYIRQTAGTGTLTPSHIDIKLCSDTAGNTPVYSFPVPSVGMTSRWCHFVIDCGSYMTTPINSIALYVTRDVGACTFQLNSVIACKGPNDSDLLHQGNIISSKRTLGVSPYTKDGWWPIRYITGKYIITSSSFINQNFVTSVNNTTPSFIGYTFNNNSDTTVKTVASIYAIEPMDTWTPRLNYAPNSTILQVNTISSDNITLSGGWNRTDMSTRIADDMTWLGSPNGAGYGLHLSIRNNVNIQRIGLTNFYYGVNMSAQCYNINFDSCETSGNLYGVNLSSITTSSFPINPPGNITFKNSYHIADVNAIAASSSSGISYENVVIKSSSYAFNFSGSDDNTFKNIHLEGVTYGFYLSTSSFNKVKQLWCENYRTFHYVLTGEVFHNTYNYLYLNNGSRFGEIGNGITYTQSDFMNVDVNGLTNNIVGSNIMQVDGLSNDSSSWGYSTLSGNNTRYHGWYRVENDNSVSVSGTSLKIIPNTTASIPYKAVPYRYVLASVAVTGGIPVIFSVWLRKNSTVFLPKLVCPPQLPGISDYVYSQPLVNLNTWEQFEVTVNPTISGVLDFEIHLDIDTTSSISSSNNVWIDDIECSQQ